MFKIPVFYRTILVVLLLLTFAASANSTVIRVKTDGDNANDGSTWSLAKQTLSGADGALASAMPGDEIWVAAGVYTEKITLKEDVDLYGGFAGTEESRELRNPMANFSILDANFTGTVVTSPSGITDATVLDGFIIRGGKGTNGGGIFCQSSSPVISNNIIMCNNATANGGGICCYSASPRIERNIIVCNTANYNGGAIACSTSSNPTLLANRIAGNVASLGGAIYCSSSAPVIYSTTIAGNTAVTNGGGIYCTSSSPKVVNNTIISNTAVGGGGVYLTSNSSPTIANTIVAYNSSGLYRSGGNPVVKYNCISQNSAYNYSGITTPDATNLSADTEPGMACFTVGNIHLQPESPCVNAGANTVTDPSGNPVALPLVDTDGQDRVLDETVDIGADESDETTYPVGAYAVLRVSSTGDNANDGLTWAAAKHDIQAAIYAALAQGGEIWVKSDTYNGQITVLPYTYIVGGFAGTETDRLQRNTTLNPTVLDGQQVGTVVTIAAGNRNCAVSGFNIRNSAGGTDGCGVLCANYSSSLITGNVIEDNLGSGVYCNQSSSTVANNIIVGNSDGVVCNATPSAYIANNTIVNNSNNGVLLQNAAAVDVKNNIVVSNNVGIASSSSSGSVDFNCVYGNTTADYQSITPGTGSISEDPMFVDWANRDFHLLPGSPCIEAGTNDIVNPLWLDIDDEPRISGASVDIGADEVQFTFTDMPVTSIKTIADGVEVSCTGAVVTAAYDGFFYIQDSDYSCGLRVDKPDHNLQPNQTVTVLGNIGTNLDGERYIAAILAIPDGFGSVKPIAMPHRLLGGADYLEGTTLCQEGVEGGFGVNTIGLLVKVYGRVIESGTDYFILDDGSNIGLKVLNATAVEQSYVSVVGISSCMRPAPDAKPIRILRACSQDDVVTLQDPQ